MSAEVQTLGGRPIIDADTEILGGVFLARKAVYVDFAENPGPYEAIYAEIDGALGSEAQSTPLSVGRTVNDVVGNMVRFDDNKVSALHRREARIRGLEELSRTDQVDLSTYIEDGGGVCTQQALVVGTMLRLLQMRRGIGGMVSIEPREAPIPSHIWVRYTHGLQKIIVDPYWITPNKLDEMPGRIRKHYLRPEEEPAPIPLNQLALAAA